jgi:hypothetical protein|nr:MAG TPA: hypothetical protein [Caudoviricetes sp.]
MDISVSINSKSEDEYRIILSPFNLDIIPLEVREILGDSIEIADVTLERAKGDNPTDIGVLLKISNVIGEIFNDNENLILYFYCDDIHDILRRDKRVTPQKFRSNLFSRMFEKYMLSNGITDIINTPIEIKADRHIYIHLISRSIHLEYVKAIKDVIMDMESK